MKRRYHHFYACSQHCDSTVCQSQNLNFQRHRAPTPVSASKKSVQNHYQHEKDLEFQLMRSRIETWNDMISIAFTVILPRDRALIRKLECRQPRTYSALARSERGIASYRCELVPSSSETIDNVSRDEDNWHKLSIPCLSSVP